MKKLLLFTFLFSAFISCKNNETKIGQEVETEAEKSIAQQIAEAHGLNNFDEVEEIQFTFNVRVEDSLRTSREWTWKPQTDEIRLTEGDISRNYTRTDNIAEDDKDIDQKFINDSYWFLFPFQMVWSDAEISEEKTGIAPISKEEMKYLEVSYKDEGGYTPGDTYVVYYNDDYLLEEWIYKSADGQREMPTTWEDFEDFQGLKISKSHKSPDGSFELFFTDIEVK
ncbi:hypothetical protein APR41_03505 [Salegentibacter salinarum]|uniref:Selenophosphate synthetase n=1 Tax=Salegentibacter salinarum TaxID=447422 RepID=A0A2N0TU11_9FLAO|nr:hypothetical protein [Salegentibacter salinarum]PKD18229.1 hypothetical protein APR41_03505 [Salegentibacter salinarum]SKB43104.1 hypothetical protein SAMN05660903_00713 [Salegentibacter salinarum]